MQPHTIRRSGYFACIYPVKLTTRKGREFQKFEQGTYNIEQTNFLQTF